MNPTPLVSVLMPVFNAEKYLREAIESILNQTFADFEFLILNDGSTDGSKEIILSYADTRIRYVENESNLGLIETLNKGIALCKGKYIARMDSDDISLPDRLRRQYRFMEKYPNIGVCGTWAKVIGAGNVVEGKIVNQTHPSFVSIHLLFSVPLVHPSCFIRTAILQKHPYHPMPATEDYDLWCRLNDVTRMANLPAFLLHYRWHASNVSNEQKQIQEENKKQIIRWELQKLHLNPDDEMLRIHRLSFLLHGFNSSVSIENRSDDLQLSAQWFEQLLLANKQYKRYHHQAFVAYLWSRWIVLCLKGGEKKRMFRPSFADFRPKVLYYLLRQVGLLVKK